MVGREVPSAVRWAIGAGAVVGVLALALVLGLWAAGNRRDCTTMGSAPSHVAVTLETPGWTVTELCVDRDCEAADRVAVSDEADAYPFRATAVGPDGTVVEHSGEVTTTEVWPNGEGCGSRRAYATIEIAADGTVTTTNPWVGAET